MKKLTLFLALLPSFLFSQTVSIDKLVTCEERLQFEVSAHGFSNVAAISLKIAFDNDIQYDSIFDLSPRFASGYCVYQYSVAQHALFFSWFDPVYWFYCADTMTFFNIKCHRVSYNSIINNVYFDCTQNYYNEIGDTSGIAQGTFWDNGYVVCDPTYLQEYRNEINSNGVQRFDILGRETRQQTGFNKGKVIITPKL